MSIPGFSAESALEPTIGKYQSKAIFNRSNRAELSMQQFSAPFPGRGRFGLTMTCCDYVPLHGLFCIEGYGSPIENCRCRRGPIIDCRGPIVTSE